MLISMQISYHKKLILQSTWKTFFYCSMTLKIVFVYIGRQGTNIKWTWNVKILILQWVKVMYKTWIIVRSIDQKMSATIFDLPKGLMLTNILPFLTSTDAINLRKSNVGNISEEFDWNRNTDKLRLKSC